MSGLPYTLDNRPAYHEGSDEACPSLPYPQHQQSEFGGADDRHGKVEPDVYAWSVEPLEGKLSSKLMSKSGLIGKAVDKGTLLTAHCTHLLI